MNKDTTEREIREIRGMMNKLEKRVRLLEEHLRDECGIEPRQESEEDFDAWFNSNL